VNGIYSEIFVRQRQKVFGYVLKIALMTMTNKDLELVKERIW